MGDSKTSSIENLAINGKSSQKTRFELLGQGIVICPLYKNILWENQILKGTDSQDVFILK